MSIEERGGDAMNGAEARTEAELDAAMDTSTEVTTEADAEAVIETEPETMMKYGDSRLRASLDETPGGLQGKPYLDAVKIREETVARTTKEIAAYDAVIMTGPTDIMHFCGFPSVTIAGKTKTEEGVNQALILYGCDEYRLYEAALAVEQVLLSEK